jgi:hypothetical protein
LLVARIVAVAPFSSTRNSKADSESIKPPHGQGVDDSPTTPAANAGVAFLWQPQAAVSYDGRVSEGVSHVQTVNNDHERLKTWTNRQLRGIATKYLDNYLAWMRMWEWLKEGVKPEHFIISGLGRQLLNR